MRMLQIFFLAYANLNGKTMVICFNAGFYEIDIITTPISSKYSVLDWNQPGFGGRTVSFTIYFFKKVILNDLSIKLF